MLAWLWRRKRPAQVEQLLQSAIRHHEAGRLLEADAAYRRIIELDPRNIDALHFRGFLLFQRGEHSSAVDLIGRSLALNPSNAPALVNLANAYQAVGDALRASGC